jgi:hypothetical protein
MSYYLFVWAQTRAEAEAYAVVLAARGCNPKVNGNTVRVYPGNRQQGGKAVLQGFLRWAQEANLTPRISCGEGNSSSYERGQRPLSEAEIDSAIQQYSPGSNEPWVSALVDSAEHADSLREVRAKIVALTAKVGKGDMGYGGVNIDAATTQVVDYLVYKTEELIAERDQLKAENARLSAITAERDQLKTGLAELKSLVRRTWMPAKSRRKLEALVPPLRY